MNDTFNTKTLVGEGFSDDPASSHAPHGRYYTDPDVHNLELEKVFRREWNFFCHQSEIPNAGDYITGDIAEEPVYVIRSKDNEIRAFYNVCQHRGHQLLKGKGNLRSVVVCPYHAWSYDLQGRLRGAPKMKEVKGFDRSSVHLTTVRTEVIGGFVFLNLDDNAPSLRESVPEFEPIITSMAAEVENLQLVKKKAYDIAANWKIVTENFLEAYHVEFSGEAHTALGNIIDIETYRYNISGQTIEYTAGGGKPEVIPYKMNEKDEFTNSKDSPFHQVFLYPNITFSVFPGTNMMFVFNIRPNGPHKTAEEIIYFTLDGSLSEPSASAEAYVSERLNLEDVELVEAVHRGMKSKGYKPGRLMVDELAEAGWGEQFIHHFNQLNLAALTR